MGTEKVSSSWRRGAAGYLLDLCPLLHGWIRLPSRRRRRPQDASADDEAFVDGAPARRRGPELANTAGILAVTHQTPLTRSVLRCAPAGRPGVANLPNRRPATVPQCCRLPRGLRTGSARRCQGWRPPWSAHRTPTAAPRTLACGRRSRSLSR